jgi:hypothetical protein
MYRGTHYGCPWRIKFLQARANTEEEETGLGKNKSLSKNVSIGPWGLRKKLEQSPPKI